jgi:hypothetical protein
LAAGYAEVWNPPEASGHDARGHGTKAARSKPAAVKGGSNARTGGKAGAGAHERRVASVRHRASHVAPRVAGHGSKLAAHGGGAKGVAASAGMKGGANGGMRIAATGKTRTDGIASARAAKSHTQAHAQLVHAKSAQGKLMRADFAPGRGSRPHVIKAAAKPAVSAPVMSSGSVGQAAPTSPAQSANVGNIVPMGASPNPASPATARSGSLPPIIH